MIYSQLAPETFIIGESRTAELRSFASAGENSDRTLKAGMNLLSIDSL